MGAALHFQRELPGYARTLVLLQSILIAYFSFWMVEEYQNNKYFQEYVQDKFPAGLPFLALVGVLSVLAAGVGIYGRSRNLGTSRARIVLAEKLVPRSPRFELAPSSVRGSGLISPESDRSESSSPAELSLFAASEAKGDPPVLRRIELPPNFAHNRSEPKPFPVIRRIEPLEEPDQDEKGEIPQTILKRIAPRDSSSVPQSPLGSVRRVEPRLESSGRPLVWKSRSDAKETGPADSQDAPLLDKLPRPGREERQADSDGITWKKRSKSKRSGPSDGVLNESAA